MHLLFLSLFLILIFGQPRLLASALTSAYTDAPTTQTTSFNDPGFNLNDTWVAFSPARKVVILQYNTANLTIALHNGNEAPVLAQIQYDRSTMTTTVFVAPELEGWNVTLNASSTQIVTIDLYGAQPGRAAILVNYLNVDDNTQPLAVDYTKYEVSKIKPFHETNLLGWSMVCSLSREIADCVYDCAMDLPSGTAPVEVFRFHTVLQKISVIGLALGFAMTMSSWSCILHPATIDLYITYKRLPFIQIVCQFIFKPLIGFGLAAAFSLPGPIAYGLLALGCTPGTGPSNMSTYLLGGNYNASTIMTMISALFSMIAIPFWMYTLGEVIAGNTYGQNWVLYFPWLLLFVIVLIFIIPSIIFYIIRRHSEYTGRRLAIILRPLGSVIVLAAFVLAIYSDLWLWPFLTDWTFIMCAFIYVISCYALGFLGALIVRIPLPTCIAMSMEIGLQNVSIGLVVVHGTLPNPDNDNAMVIPIMYVFMMFGPMLVSLVIKLILRMIRRKRSGDYDMDDLSESGKSSERQDQDTSKSGATPNNVTDIHTTYNRMCSELSLSNECSSLNSDMSTTKVVDTNDKHLLITDEIL